MTVLDSDRDTRERLGQLLGPIDVAASTLIYKKKLVALNSAGDLVPAADSASLGHALGVSYDHYDNSDGDAGDITAEVACGMAYLFDASGADATWLGQLAYVTDENTVALSNTNKNIAGVCVGVDSATAVWVWIGPPAVPAALAGSSVVTADIAAKAVTTAKIDDGAVTATQLGALAVTDAKLNTAAVTAGKIATGGVSASNQFGSGVVDTTALGANAVTLAKLATGITPSHVVKFAGKITWSGSGASLATTISGIVSTDIVICTIQTAPTQAAYLVSAAPTTDTLTITLSAANTGNNAVIGYMILRAAA